MACHRVVGAAKRGRVEGERRNVPESWVMIGEPARTKARHWEEDDHQEQKLVRSSEQVNRSIALHSPKLPRAGCSLSVLHPRPLHLLLHQAN